MCSSKKLEVSLNKVHGKRALSWDLSEAQGMCCQSIQWGRLMVWQISTEIFGWDMEAGHWTGAPFHYSWAQSNFQPKLWQQEMQQINQAFFHLKSPLCTNVNLGNLCPEGRKNADSFQRARPSDTKPGAGKHS